MAFLITTPDVISGAATDLAGISSTVAVANALAAAPTSGILAAAQDEVSIQIAAMFSQYAGEYQRLSQDMAAFHAEFVQALNTAAGSYASAEATSAVGLASPSMSFVPSVPGLFVDLFDTLIYQPIYLVGQFWITNPIGEFIDNNLINPIGQVL
ncbi:PE family protein, partial [Mycobacterium sp.]|uniref:PE family protein n=1 Tax=Mycobacterium sp. TaxID=1785 RepID=UPI003C74D3CC